MTDRHSNRHWDSFLPPAFNWIDDLNVSPVTKTTNTGWTAVPVACKADPEVKAQLPGNLVKDITTKIKSIGWKANSPLPIEIDGSNLILCPITKLDVTNSQKGREMGLNLARSLEGMIYDTLTIASDEQANYHDVLEGYLCGCYDAGLFKGKHPDKKLPKEIQTLAPLSDDEIAETKASAKSLLLTRLLQDAPASWLTPPKWGEIVKSLFKNAEVEIMNREKLASLNMGSFLSVAAGSPLEPQLISIKIKGKNPKKTVALVGKGLTFDAGGISLKAPAGMGEMKYDMSGGAAVTGAAYFFSQCQPEHNVHCIIGAVENMPSGTATRPGDVVQASNGKTIEVLNTDAEGRLVLADCLVYASNQSPDLIMDFATLTGAVLHGLGHSGAAFMTPNEHVAQLIKSNGSRSGEPVWQLPLWPELTKEIKSEVADLKNIAKPNVLAGTIIGGVFLKEFVGKGIPWAHVDIAGTAWSCSATGYPKSGASAFGVKLMASVVRNLEL